jgi:hypothetical protein
MTMFEDIFKPIAKFCTIEPPWFSNQIGISCIPAGIYTCIVRYSDKYGRHLIVKDVEGRTLILLHWGNYNKNTKGCILIGTKFADINGDGETDITASKAAFNRLMSHIKDGETIELTITEAKPI